MKSKTSKTASPYFNIIVGRTDGTPAPRVTDDDIERGKRRLRIEFIEDVMALRHGLKEVWEDG